jgi:hypothetical protein
VQRALNLTSPKNQWNGTSTDNDPQGTTATSQPPCHRQGRRQKLSESDPSIACTMEHRAPNDKGGSRGGGGMGIPAPDLATIRREPTPSSKSGRHYVVLAAETPRGRTDILAPESTATCWERAVRARSSHHHAAPTTKSLSASHHK